VPPPQGPATEEQILSDLPEPPRPRAAARGAGGDPAFWRDEPPRARRPRRPLPDGPLDRLREIVTAWRGDARAGLVALAVVAVVAGVVWYQVGVGGADDAPPRTSVATTPSTSSATEAAPAETTGGGDADEEAVVVVHVAGAVTQPGVVELKAGARVIDAVEAAGGALATADLDRMNLAVELTDGQRVLVQNVGDPPAPGSAPGDPSGSTGAAPGETPGGLLDLNTATSEQLEELPGIGPVLAEAILSERERRGGFRNVLELRDVRGIGEKRFADLVDLVTV
jgi:competence protein ComEA